MRAMHEVSGAANITSLSQAARCRRLSAAQTRAAEGGIGCGAICRNMAPRLMPAVQEPDCNLQHCNTLDMVNHNQ